MTINHHDIAILKGWIIAFTELFPRNESNRSSINGAIGNTYAEGIAYRCVASDLHSKTAWLKGLLP